MPTVLVKRGLRANLPTSAMTAGEVLHTTDQGTAYLATGATTKIPLVPATDDLAVLPAVDVADLIMVHDVSESAAQKEKKITFNAFKTALNIPAGATDEKVSVVAGGTSGYLWGTNGNDGILRMNTSMAWVKDAGNAFVTLAVGTVDCGTF